MDMILNSNIECLVYQMGKVGSTALVNALNNAGKPTEQVHYLSEETIDLIVDKVKTRDLTDWAVWHDTMQLAKSLRLYNLVQSYKEGRRNHRLKVITLTRHPVDWWISEFFQNWEVNKLDFLKWTALQGQDLSQRKITADHIITYFEAVMRKVADLGVTGGEAPPLLDEVLNPAAARLLRPTRWFDNQFRDVFSIDLNKESSVLEHDYEIHHLEHFDILLLRYEDLKELAQSAINDLFKEKVYLDLKQSNTTNSKHGINALYRLVKRNFTLPEDLKDKLGTTPYCRKFYPSVPSAAKEPEGLFSRLSRTLSEWGGADRRV